MGSLVDHRKRHDGPQIRSLPGVEFGEFGGSGLLQLGVALARLPEMDHDFAMVAGPVNHGVQTAVIVVSRPAHP
jgi:hypothetical protein